MNRIQKVISKLRTSRSPLHSASKHRACPFRSEGRGLCKQLRRFLAEQSRPSSPHYVLSATASHSLLETSSLKSYSISGAPVPSATPSSQVPFSLQITQWNQELNLLTRENKKAGEVSITTNASLRASYLLSSPTSMQVWRPFLLPCLLLPSQWSLPLSADQQQERKAVTNETHT